MVPKEQEGGVVCVCGEEVCMHVFVKKQDGFRRFITA